MQTAREQGLLSCHCCGLVQQAPPANTLHLNCSRCHLRLHSRHPHSIAKCWALCIASIIMLLPANLYPIMIVTSLRAETPDTILSGVSHLIQAGQYPIAAVVFIASIAVPALKLISMFVLLIVVQKHWRLNPKQCTFLYRLVEFIGRWSMLDLFVIAILMALVNLGQVAQITAGPAATAFLSVVILTMLAAMSFDPRLLWDLQYDDPSIRSANEQPASAEAN